MSETRDPESDQPLPVPGQQNVQDAMVAATRQREQFGKAKYGTSLMTHNGRDALQDAWEESADLFAYLTQALLERNAAKDTLRELLAKAFTEAAYECDGKCGLEEQACNDAHPILFSGLAAGDTHVAGDVGALADLALKTLGPAALSRATGQADTFLTDLVGMHRPVVRRSPMTYGPTYDAQCAACDGNRWRMIRLPRDEVPECRFWAEAKARGLVKDQPVADITQEENDGHDSAL